MSQKRQDRHVVVTSVPSAPETVKYPPAIVDDVIPHAGVPRANTNPSREHPDGQPTIGEPIRSKNKTVIQQHVDFFDLNGDGYISIDETWRSARILGFNIIQSIIGVLVIHFYFAPLLAFSVFDPNLFLLRLPISEMHRGKHGSDTRVFDREGRFVPQEFENLFSKFDKEKKGGLGFWEGVEMIKHNREAYDIPGVSAAIFEWGFTWILLADRSRGMVEKEKIRQIYDGTIFYKIAENRGYKLYRAPMRAQASPVQQPSKSEL